MSSDIELYEGERFPALAQQSEELQAIIRENLGDGGLEPSDLTRISIPSGGSTSWEIETLTGVEESKTIEGVIIAWGTTRRYWAVSLDDVDETTPPDCASTDGITGLGQFGVGSSMHPTGDCLTCPMAQYGSGSDDGNKKGPQACSEGKILFILREGDIIPVTVTCPPTSIRPLRDYLTGLVKALKPVSGVVTRLELEKAEKNGKKWSIVKPTLVGTLDPEVTAKAREMGASVKNDYLTRMAEMRASALEEDSEVVDVQTVEDVAGTD